MTSSLCNFRLSIHLSNGLLITLRVVGNFWNFCGFKDGHTFFRQADCFVVLLMMLLLFLRPWLSSNNCHNNSRSHQFPLSNFTCHVMITNQNHQFWDFPFFLFLFFLTGFLPLRNWLLCLKWEAHDHNQIRLLVSVFLSCFVVSLSCPFVPSHFQPREETVSDRGHLSRIKRVLWLRTALLSIYASFCDKVAEEKNASLVNYMYAKLSVDFECYFMFVMIMKSFAWGKGVSS